MNSRASHFLPVALLASALLASGYGAHFFASIGHARSAADSLEQRFAVIGSVWVDPTNRAVLIQGYVNQTNGLVDC